MTGIVILLWLGNMLTDTGGQLAFKAAASGGCAKSWLGHWRYMATRPWIWLGVAFYIGEFFFWTAFLAHVQLSTAMMLASFDTVAIMLGGRLFFKEVLPMWRLSGILLVTAGVAIVGFGA